MVWLLSEKRKTSASALQLVKASVLAESSGSASVLTNILSPWQFQVGAAPLFPC